MVKEYGCANNSHVKSISVACDQHKYRIIRSDIEYLARLLRSCEVLNFNTINVQLANKLNSAYVNVEFLHMYSVGL